MIREAASFADSSLVVPDSLQTAMLPTDNFETPMASPIVSPLSSAAPVVSRQPAAAVATIPVLHVINGENYAGAERVQDLLAQQLSTFGFSVGFACVKLDAFDALRECRNTPLYNVPMFGRFDLSAAFRVAKIVRRGGYRLLHAHTVRSAMVGSLASMMSGVPMVSHVHSPTTRDTTRRWTNFTNGLIERQCLRRASRLIAVSQAIADYLIARGFDQKRIVVVPNGVPLVKNLPDRDPPHRLWTLGVVALFRPRKGVEVLLDSLAILRDHGVNVQLRAVGTFESADYAAEIASRASRLGLSHRIAWPGFTTDVTSELFRMDLLVLPSLFGEGLPMVVLEAMAAGVPVVATEVEGVPEAIRNGVDGVLAKPGDAADLARAIAQVVHGTPDWSTMRANVLARQATHFSDVAMAAGVAHVYREVLDRDTR